MGLTVKGSPMTQGQVKTAETLLGVGKALGAGSLAAEACIFDAIYESSVGELMGAGHKYGGVLGGAASIFATDASSNVAQATAFFQGVQGFQHGGAIELARRSSDVVYIGCQVTAATPFDSQGYSTQYESQGFPFASAVAEAKAIVAAYGGATLKGGTAGAGSGSTGTVPDGSAATTYPFSIGGASNPDEDYWTGINRLAQGVNWYLFSDGEYLFYLDGQEMLAQTPAVHLDRVRDAARIYENQGHLSYDNTAFSNMADHKRKFRTQRRTKVSVAQSPTECTFSLICGIEEVLGGDVVELSGFGLADGRWIVSECRRSVFQTYSELTLVPAIAPITEVVAAGTSGKNQGPLASPGSGRGAPSSVHLTRGATNPAPGAVWGRLDMGFDGNYGPRGAVAPFSGTIQGIGISGWPGQGQYFAVVNDDQSGPDYTRCMYFAEGATPLFHNGTHVAAGQQIGRPVAAGGTGQPGNFEIGPANTSNFDTLAKTYGLGSSGSRAMVMSFYDWLRTLGADASTNTSAAGNT